MPNFPIVDTHLHLWDPKRLRYSWLDGNVLLDKPYLVEDYRRDCGEVAVEAMVFLECYADFTEKGGQYLEEIEFVRGEAARDPRVKGIIPMAPLERGAGVEPMLAEMAGRYPEVKGIRRIIEFEADPAGLALSDAFLAGVKLLPKYGMHFEINVNFTQMDIVLDFVGRAPEVPMILDHCGKPGIRDGRLDQYRQQISALARHEHVLCKLSDLPVEADPKNWTEAELRPYIDATIEAFGAERLIFGGDWPVLLQASTIPRWIEVLDRALAGLSDSEKRAIFRDNANRFYRLGL